MAARFFASVRTRSASAAPRFEVLGTDARHALRLELVFETETLAVFASPDLPCALVEGRGGVVLGSMFRREDDLAGGSRDIRTGDPVLGPRVNRSGGDSLLKDAWGGYVAILTSPTDAAVHILRDPSGGQPCYWFAKGDQTYLFSDVDDPIALGLLEPCLDPEYIGHHLGFPDLRTARTGLVGVQDLPEGVRLSISPTGVDLVCRWTPWRFATGRRVAPRSQVAVRLRKEIDRCVVAWSASARNPLLELSGGLDSSIIAAALAGAENVRLRCVTLATADPSADERDYARSMAQAIGAPLYEIALTLDQADPCRGPARALPRPGLGVLQQIVDQAIAGAAGAEIDSFFSGGGGDSVFCYLSTTAPAADALRLGRGRTAWRAVRDLSNLHDCTLWRAAYLAVRKALRPAKLAWRRDALFLAAGAAPAAPWPHPWLDPPANILPGTLEHVVALMRLQNISDGKERLARAPIRYPLLSQPVVELCLGIPSWMWIAGGRNRAVARDAFADRLPSDILARRSKGDFVPFCGAIYQRHREALKQHLLGGWLDGQGLLDGAAVRAYLDASGPPQGEGFYRLLELAAVESWARFWTARGASSAGG